MSDMNVNQVLEQMRAMATQAQGAPAASAIPAEGMPEFSNILKNAIDSVNDVQSASGKLQEAFEKGDANVSLAEVMVASQKASLSFQAMTQVRNKLLEAYKEVMNMPV